MDACEVEGLFVCKLIDVSSPFARLDVVSCIFDVNGCFVGRLIDIGSLVDEMPGVV